MNYSGIIVLLLCGCSISAMADEVDLINKTYEAWVASANKKEIGEWSSFLDEDPCFSPPDSTPLTSKQEVIDYYQRLFIDPEFSLDCQQVEVVVARSGEMAWSRGHCKFTFTDDSGQKVRGNSTWFKVWKKQVDGSWKGQVNTWKPQN